MKRLDPRLINALLLGALALGLTLMLRALDTWSATSVGSLFLFISATAIGLPGAIISGTVALAPTIILEGGSLDGLRLFLTCLAVGVAAERAPKVPPCIVVILSWCAVWLLMAVFPLTPPIDLPRWGLAAVIEIVLSTVAGALLLNPSAWAIVAQRPRVPSATALLVHVLILVAFVAMWSGLAVFSDHMSLPLTALDSLLWGGKLLAIGLILPALIGYRLARILSRDVHGWFRQGQITLPTGFSGLSSGFWRRLESADVTRSSTSGELERQGNAATESTNAHPAGITPDRGICALNRDGTVTFINRRFAKLCGLKSAAVIGRKIDAIGLSPELCSHIFRLTEETLVKGARIAEVKLNRLPDPLRFFEVVVTPASEIEGSAMSGGPESVIVSLKDITDRRTVEEHLLQAQRLGSLGELVDGVAHAFNNALTTIVGQASFARVAGDQTATRAALEEILAAANRASDLVAKLRTLSTATPTLMTDHDLGAVVEARVTLLRSLVGENYEIVFRRPENGIVSVCDPNLFAQALTNLVLNARDAYKGKSGAIEIVLSTETLDDDVCDLFIGARPGTFARLSIKDTGLGMSPETLARAFDPLFTTKRSQGNSGLGLSIVHAIVRAHDGFLAAESHPEKGTTITVYLPVRSFVPAQLTEPEKQAPRPIDSLDAIAGNHERILVVEDEKQVRELVTSMLSQLGYDVVSCTDGREAIERCRETEFDLIVLDMIMPRMSGLDVVAHIRSTGRTTRTLLMTGYGVAAPTTEPKQPLLAKPFDLVTLATAVKQTLSEPKPVASPAPASD